MKNGVKKAIKNWVDSAQYDIETAGHMFKTGRYIYTVFMCHLGLEKILKAKTEQETGKMPPKTHDLEHLVKMAQLIPPEEMENFIAEISNLSIVTRYPSDFRRMLKDFSRKKTELILKKTKEAFQWIRKSIVL